MGKMVKMGMIEWEWRRLRKLRRENPEKTCITDEYIIASLVAGERVRLANGDDCNQCVLVDPETLQGDWA